MKTIAFFGSAGSGKSQIFSRLCGDKFEPRCIPEFNSRVYILNEGEQRLRLIDTPGQYQYDIKSEHYDIDVIALVYNRSNSSHEATSYYRSLFPDKEYIYIEANDDIGDIRNRLLSYT